MAFIAVTEQAPLKLSDHWQQTQTQSKLTYVLIGVVVVNPGVTLSVHVEVKESMR